MNKMITLFAAAGMSLSLSTLAQADTAVQGRFEKVQFTESEVNRDPAAVYRRIKRAATNVCSTLDWNGPLWRKQVHADCVRFAIENAVTQVNRPVLSAYAQTRDGGFRKFS